MGTTKTELATSDTAKMYIANFLGYNGSSEKVFISILPIKFTNPCP